MKTNEAPERLYLSKNIYSTFLYQVPDPDDETVVEYTRTDAFVDKTCNWLEEHLYDIKELEEAAFDYAESCKYDGGEKLLCVEHFKAGAKWADAHPIHNEDVDLEKELKAIDDAFFDLDGVAVKAATSYLTVEDVKDIARHFFNLGLKAKEV